MVASVSLAAAKPDDYALAKRWLDEPAIHRWLEPAFQSGDLTRAQYLLLVARDENRLFVLSADGRPAGLVGLARISRRHQTAEVWYLLGDASLAGRGVTTRAVGLAVEHGFRELGLHALRAWVAAPNVASLRLLEKLGFTRAGVFREAFADGGARHDTIHFELLRSDWEAR